MFLVDSALAAQDWQKILNELQRILDRAEAEVVSQKKWDERRLCYDIQGKSRGTYILIYFNCDTEKVKGIERDVQLSELIIRTLILRTDRMSTEDMEKPTPLETEAADEDQKPRPEDVENTDADDEPDTDDDNSDFSEEDNDDTTEIA
jgi:small subunit ribosomal protein S6